MCSKTSCSNIWVNYRCENRLHDPLVFLFVSSPAKVWASKTGQNLSFLQNSIWLFSTHFSRKMGLPPTRLLPGGSRCCDCRCEYQTKMKHRCLTEWPSNQKKIEGQPFEWVSISFLIVFHFRTANSCSSALSVLGTGKVRSTTLLVI